MATTVSGTTSSAGGTSRSAPSRRSRARVGSGSVRSILANPSVRIGAAAAAIGLVAGLAANFGRKAIVQAPSALKGDWMEALKAEHRMTLAIFDRLEATRDDQTYRRGMMLAQLKHALAKHAAEEENIVYPALRDAGESAEADHLNHDHGYVKQYLHELEAMPKDSPAWINKVREFRRELEKHVREEEQEIFPTLHAQLSDDQNGKVTAAMNREGFLAA